jgi:hypothetical protein
MVCKRNAGDLYWFRPRNTLRPVGEASSVLSCTEVLVVGVTSGYEREELPSLKRRTGVCVTLLVPSQGPGELSARVLLCVAMVVILLLFCWNDPCMLFL